MSRKSDYVFYIGAELDRVQGWDLDVVIKMVPRLRRKSNQQLAQLLTALKSADNVAALDELYHIKQGVI